MWRKGPIVTSREFLYLGVRARQAAADERVKR
jgi:hypothetical protein